MGRKPAANVGLDEQEPDRRPVSPGKGAMDSDARYSSVRDTGKSGRRRQEVMHLTPGDLSGCL